MDVRISSKLEVCSDTHSSRCYYVGKDTHIYAFTHIYTKHIPVNKIFGPSIMHILNFNPCCHNFPKRCSLFT